jgi:uncharacterized repeat protein (TIGR01451 family)
VQYRITINNDGPSAATGVQIDDSLVAALRNATWTCSPSAGASCARASGVGSPLVQASIGVGAEVVLVVDATIDPASDGTLSNTVDVTLPPTIVDPTPGPVPGTTSATDSTSLVPTADLSVTKSNGVTSAVPGEQATYTITVRNSGPSAASGVTVTDAIPASLLYATWTCSATGGSNCASASGVGGIASSVDLAPNGVATYTLIAEIDQQATGTLTNTVSVGLPSGITDPDSSDRTATDIDSLLPAADLIVTKTHSPTVVVPGQQVAYTVRVSNLGPSAANGTSIVDTLPSSLANASWTCTPTAGARCGAASGAGDLATSADLAAGTSVTYSIVADVNDSAVGVLSNTANATLAGSVTDPTPGPIPGRTGATDTTTLVPTAALSVEKTHRPTALIPGRIATFDIVVRNDGPSVANNVVVADSLPAVLLGATWTCSATTGGTCDDPSGNGSVNTTVDLGVGAVATISVNATIDATATGTLSNTATITAPAGVIDDPSDNSDTDADGVVPTADLNIVKTHTPSVLVPGEAVTYIVTVTNDGPSAVNGARVLDPLPATIDGVVWTCLLAVRCASSSTLTGNLDATISLPAGTSVEFRGVGVVDPMATSSIVNTATVFVPAGVTDPDGQNNTADDSPDVQPQADVVVTKELLSGPPVPGATATYRVTATNRGPSHAPSVRLYDQLPASLLDATWTCAGAGGANCGQADGLGSPDVSVNLPVNGTATVTVSARIDPSARGTLSNTAIATLPSGITALTPSNDRASVSQPLVPTVNVQIAKAHTPAVIVPGLPITYSVTVSNTGPSAVQGVGVTDRMPTDLLGVVWTCQASPGSTCAETLGSGDIDSTVDLEPQGVATFTIAATVDPSSTGQLANVAGLTIPGDVTDTNPLDNTALDSTFVEPMTDLSVTKSNKVSSLVPGTETTYTLTVENIGPSAAVGASVTDALPAGLRNAVWSCVATLGACASASGTGSISTTVDLLPSGRAIFLVTADIDQASVGALTNLARVAPGTGQVDQTTTNNEADDTDDLVPTADLSLVKSSGSNGVAPGSQVIYTIIATNNGPSRAPATRIEDALPSELSGATWTCVTSSSAPCSSASGTGSPNVTADLDAGATMTVTITATVDSAATGQIVNTATVATGPGVLDPDPSDNDASDTDPLRPTVDVSVTKVHQGEVVAGRPVSYVITVDNAGPSWARGVRVLDPLPAGLANAVWTCSADGGGSCATANGTGTIDASVILPPSAQAVFRLTADLDAAFTGTLTNTARALLPSTVIDVAPANNEATDAVAVGVTADLAITKALVGGASATASPAVYEIVMTNNGPSAVSGARVVDRLPAGTLSAAWTCAGRNGGSCVTSSGVATVQQGVFATRTPVDLPVGGSVVVGVTMTFTPTAGQLVNEADAVLPIGAIDPISTNNTAVHTVRGLVPVAPTESTVAPGTGPRTSVGPAAQDAVATTVPESAVTTSVAGPTTNPVTASPISAGPVGAGPITGSQSAAKAGPSVAAEGAQRELALTGAEVGRLIGISIALALFGWGLTMAARRRTSRR